jgi:hypothetical protein
MNRCPKRLTALRFTPLVIALVATLGLFSAPARAQTQSLVPIPLPLRHFPDAALRGDLVIMTPPMIQLDGHPDQLSPGARILGPHNMMLMSGALVGRDLTVNYLRDSAGLISEVWILNDVEARQSRRGAMTTRNFVFSSEINTTPRDDGKTPFNQLPVYPNH